MKNYIRIIVVCLLAGMPKLFDAVYVAPKMTSADVAKKLNTHEARMEQLKKEREQKVQELQKKIQKGEIKTLFEIKQAQESLDKKLAAEEQEFEKIKEAAPAVLGHSAIDIVTKRELGEVKQVAESRPLKAEKEQLKVEFSALERAVAEKFVGQKELSTLLDILSKPEKIKVLTPEGIAVLAELLPDELATFAVELSENSATIYDLARQGNEDAKKLVKAMEEGVVNTALLEAKKIKNKTEILKKFFLRDYSAQEFAKTLKDVAEHLTTADFKWLETFAKKFSNLITLKSGTAFETISAQEKKIIDMVLKEVPDLTKNLEEKIRTEPGEWKSNIARSHMLGMLKGLVIDAAIAKANISDLNNKVRIALNFVGQLSKAFVTAASVGLFLAAAMAASTGAATVMGPLGIAGMGILAFGAFRLVLIPMIDALWRTGGLGDWIRNGMNAQIAKELKRPLDVVMRDVQSAIEVVSAEWVKGEVTEFYEPMEKELSTFVNTINIGVNNFNTTMQKQIQIEAQKQALKDALESLKKSMNKAFTDLSNNLFKVRQPQQPV